MSPRIQIESRELGSAVEISLRGSADVAGATLLKDLLLLAVDPSRDVLLNLAGLERLDGAGLQVLLALRMLVERAGRSFAVTALGDAAGRAIEAAGATPLFATP